MLLFFCTCCGAQLQVTAELGGSQVRCAHCSSVIRTPGGTDDSIPLATLIAPPPAATEADWADDAHAEEPPYAQIAEAGSMMPLSYVPAWPHLHEKSLALDRMAERLEHVEAEEPTDDPTAMRNCPFCGSTIAGFLRKCPFCRHALWGM